MPETLGPQDGRDAFDAFLARLLKGQQDRAAAFGRPVDMSRRLSSRTRDLLRDAAEFAMGRGQNELDALHVLYVLVDREPFASVARFADADPTALAEDIESRLPVPTDVREGARAALTHSAQRLLIDAAQAARGFGSTYTDPEHVFFAAVMAQDSVAGQLLAAAGITPRAVQEYVQSGARPEPEGAVATDTKSATPTLDQYGVDLTERARGGGIDPVIGRADEIEQTVEILLRRTKNNPVLIGEPGVGKTAIVEGLAQRIVDGDVPELLRNKRVVALDMAGMLAGAKYRGDFEERLLSAMDEIAAHRDELIVFVDELHTVVGAGAGTEGGSMDAGNILKPRLARGELHMVGATTLAEYRRVEKDAALERRFQPVQVGEPSIDDAVAILAGLAPRYAEHHGVEYGPDAIRAAVELSQRYITDRFLPDKAIDLIDQAGARRRLELAESGSGADALRAEATRLEEAKERAVAEEAYEEASQIRDRIEVIMARLAALPADDTVVTPRPSTTVSADDIAAVLARATGIPVDRVSQGDRARLVGLEQELHDRVIGQEDAVAAVARAVRRSRTGMADPRRPVGSFLFLGPTGVGKTELAKSLAASVFGDSSALIRFDMSEFGERHTVSRLIGAPPGYVGHEEAGQLTERVRRNPYSVILLDEIEKAHPDVFNLLLQVLDDGRLTDGQGRTVDFRNAVIIMTSNLGSEFMASRTGALGFTASGDGGYSPEDLRTRVMGKLRESMRPEFINRIDEIVLFQKLTQDQMRGVVALLLADTARRIAAQDMVLSVSDAATSWLAEHGYQPEYGARPLRRLVQREVDDRIASLVVDEGARPGDTLEVDVVDGVLTVRSRAVVSAV